MGRGRSRSPLPFAFAFAVTETSSQTNAAAYGRALDCSASALAVATAATSRVAARQALDCSAAALAVANVVIAADAAGRAAVPFAWIHDAVADAGVARFDLDRALAAGVIDREQHAVKRDAVRERLRTAVRMESDAGAAFVVVAFPDAAMHDATLTDAGVSFVRATHATADGKCFFVSGPAFRTRQTFADASAAVSNAIDPATVVRLPGERVAPSGSGRVARSVSLPTLADV